MSRLGREDKPAEKIQFTAKERRFVYGVAMKYVSDADRAHDVAQDALLSAYRHRHSFRGDAELNTWLYRIAVTTALMHLRQHRRRAAAGLGDDRAANDGGAANGDDAVATASSPEERVASSEAVAIASERLAELGEHYQEIFAPRFVEGCSGAEIAARLRLTLATVKTRASRARAYLRRQLGKAFAA